MLLLDVTGVSVHSRNCHKRDTCLIAYENWVHVTNDKDIFPKSLRKWDNFSV